MTHNAKKNAVLSKSRDAARFRKGRKRIATPKLVTLGFLFALILLLPPGLRVVAHHAAAQLQRAPQPASQQAGPTDPAELETFLDAFFAEEMAAAHIPGAVVVFVKDGEIFLAKGYGLADVESNTPVDPERTVFRAGSISKLFTATAIMQLAGQGRLNLDDPVNAYLQGFQLDDRYPAPITVVNLLTHTGGFDEKASGMAVADSSAVVPLGEYLAANMPPRVMPPGEWINYSNHGFALAGYLVETVSGMPYARYVDENIFRPLGMSRSSLEEPLPARLASDMATGYADVNGTLQPLPPVYFNTAPASSLYTTAVDMARFMIAHLQNGQFEGRRILDEAAARQMQQQQFTHHPGLDGWAYGFFEHTENGQRALAHGGDVPGFTSFLYLIPEENIGFFVSFNASVNLFGGGEDPRGALVSQFLDRYYPPAERVTAPDAAAPANLQRFTGNYRWNHYARTTLEKGLPPMPLLQFHITTEDDGALTLTPPAGMGKPTRWVAVEPLLFQRADGEEVIAFREDENGRITHLFFSLMEMPVAAEKVAWYETDGFQLMLMGYFVLMFLSVLAWPLAGLFRRLRKQPTPFPQPARRARALAAAVAALNLFFFLALIVRMGQVSANVFAETPAWFLALLALPPLTTILTAGLLVFTVRAWKEAYWSIGGCLHYSLISLAALAFIWFVNDWNLLGWKI